MTKLENFLEKTKLWTKKKFKTPVFYFSATPLFLRGDIIDTTSNEIRDLITNPPIPQGLESRFRDTYFRPPVPSIHGLISKDDISSHTQPARHFELFRNGHCEMQLKFSHWQTNDGKFFIFPTVVINYVVFFNYILKSILNRSELYEDLVFKLAVYNTGRRLKLPEGMRFDYDDKDDESYKLWDLDGDLQTDLITFKEIEPIKISEIMINRLYNAFGLEKCPYLKNGRFV